MYVDFNKKYVEMLAVRQVVGVEFEGEFQETNICEAPKQFHLEACLLILGSIV